MDKVKIGPDKFDENWFETVLSSIGDGIISLDQDGLVIYINDKTCTILERSREEILNKTIDDVLHLKNDAVFRPDNFIAWIASESEGGGLPKGTYILTKEGKKKYLSAHVTDISHEANKIVGKVIVIRDISQIIKAELQVIQEKDNMVKMIDELPIGMVMIDEALNIVDSNKAFNTLMGLEKKNIIEAPIGDFVQCIWSFEGGCGNGGNCIYCNLRRQLKAFIELNKPFKNFLTELKHYKNGIIESNWLNVSFLPTRTSNQVQYILTVEDHTERIQYETKINEAKNASLSMLDNLPFMVFRLDREFNCNFVNETFKKVIGLSHLELHEKINGKISSDDYLSLEKRFKSMQIENAPFTFELDVENNEGVKRHMVLFARPIVREGVSAEGALGVVLDIHDEKMAELLYRQSQQKYYSLFQNLESGIGYFKLIYNEAGKVTDSELVECNQATYDILMKSEENLVGSKVTSLNIVTEQEIHELLGYFEQVSTTGDNYHIDEIYLISINKWLEVSLYSPEKDYVAMLVTDIDEKKRTALELIKEKERSEEANRVKSEFLANMSHEIRTPLNGIVGMIDLTFMDDLNDDQKENLETAKGCVVSLIDIINDILDFSKIEAGKLNVEMERFDLSELMENIIKIHIPHLNLKDLSLDLDLSGIKEPYLIGDGKRIRQVLNNLISNAIKFTERGKITIRVQQNQAQDNQMKMTKFSVEDTGIGIESSKQDLLFSPFTQLDGSYTRQYGGTGLGLVISKQLVEMMSGTIGFRSTVGKGSVFEFTLPLELSSRDVQESAKFDVLSALNIGKTILLVEDDKVNQIVMEKMIEREGLNVIIAEDGQMALDKCNDHDFDLILMDIQMPIMDGLEATRQIRMNSKKNRMTPIVALTAFALKGDEEIFKTSGMDDYISKPIDRNNLIKMMNDMLGKKFVQASITERLMTEEIKNRIMEGPQQTKILNSETVYELKHRIKQLKKAYESEDYLVLEVNAHQLKVRFEVLKIEELKNIAFKIELELRKERYENVGLLIDQLKKIVEGFGKVGREINEENFNR